MCTAATPALLFVLLVATLSLNMMCGNQMATEGLPLSRRQRGADEYDDILAGNDFLSVFLESSLRRARKETTTVTADPTEFIQEAIITEPYIRTSREANYFNEVPQTTERRSNSLNTSDPTSSDGVIIAVHVSSSVGSQINKDSRGSEDSFSDSSTQVLDQNILSSEEHPSIIAKSSKSELNVEETDPITSDSEGSDVGISSIEANYQATVQNLPTSQQITFNPSGFLNSQSKENLAPFHHSFIYHDTPKEPGRARSVSYSTIIQAISPNNEKPPEPLERRERHYDGTATGYRNSLGSPDEQRKDISSATTEPNSYVSTSTLSTSRKSLESTYSESTTASTTQPTDKSWEKPYSPMPLIQQLPKVYGRPEQNFEVDEAVSVVTNGRTHGVQEGQNAQTAAAKKAKDDNQKVGYVVEGRNYRKYRVEERTADGFIVGEYGVVSHDDGSLRGVRYTADGTINPRLIYDALMKFLAL